MKNIVTLLMLVLISCGQQSHEYKNVKEIADELNAACPVMVDDGTRFDTVKVSENMLELNFTLIKMDKDSTDTEGLSKELKTFLINNLKNGFNIYKKQIDLKIIKQNNVVFHYIYVDKNGRTLSDIIIKPEEY